MSLASRQRQRKNGCEIRAVAKLLDQRAGIGRWVVKNKSPQAKPTPANVPASPVADKIAPTS